MANIRFVLMLLVFSGMGWSQAWQDVRSFRGTGVPAANRCNTGADLGIGYTDRNPGGQTYICRLNGAGAFTWYVAAPVGGAQPLNANLTTLSATGNVPTATALLVNPTACIANRWVMDIAADGTLTCTQPASTNLSDSASIARVGDSMGGALAGTFPNPTLAYSAVNAQTGTSYALLTTDGRADCSVLVTLTNANPIAVSIAAATGAGFPSGWCTTVLNSGVGTATITPATSTIEGAATLTLTTGQSARIVSNGTNYRAIRVGDSPTGASALDTPGAVAVVDTAGVLTQTTAFLGSRVGLTLGWVDADTISVSVGGCVTTGGTALSYAGGNITFTALDTGTRAIGTDYAMFLTAAGPKLTAIATYHASGLVPATYTAANTCLLGYLHNGVTMDARNATGDIFQYSVTSNDKLNRTYPFRAVQDLPAGVPLPGMVRVGGVAFGIYEASHEDATASAAGTSAYPASRYGVVLWASIDGWSTMQVVAQSGLRLPTWAEWLMAVEFNPGSVTPAIMNGNTGSGSSTDASGYLAEPGALTDDLAGTGAGLLGNGAYLYKVTLVNANGESMGGTASGGVTVADYTTNGKVALSAIPTGAAGTTARKIYRTLVGGSVYKLLTTIGDNSTVVYEDNIADATIAAAAAPPSWNLTGAQKGTADPTAGGRTLTGTGPRVAGWATAATRSWYSPAGISDAVGNAWEWVAQFFGGLKTASPGTGVAWGNEGDFAYNFQGQVYNPATGGYTEGLPAMLLVGGNWSDGSNAGVHDALAYSSPGYSFYYISFRSAR